MNPPFTQHIIPHRLDQGPMDQRPMDQKHMDQGRMNQGRMNAPGEDGADGERTRELMEAAARDIAEGAGTARRAAPRSNSPRSRTGL